MKSGNLGLRLLPSFENNNNVLKVATKSIVASRVVPRLGVSVPTVDFVL